MAATKTVTPDELERLFADLDGVVAGLSFKPALERCQVAVIADTKRNFAGTHGPEGQAWPPIMGLRRRGNPRLARPLRDNGLLMASVSARGGEGNISQVTDTLMEWGTNLDYAAIHQEGGTIYPKTAKALAVPFSKEAYKYDSPREFPGDLNVVWPRGRTSGFLVESKTKQKKDGTEKKGSKDLIHWLLLPKADIPARPYLGWNEPLIDRCQKILGDHGGAALRDAI